MNFLRVLHRSEGLGDHRGTMEKRQEGLWIIDSEAKTVFVDENMAEILGTIKSEMEGKHSFEYVFPEDLAAAQRLFAFKKEGKADPFHFRLRRKDGSAIWVDVMGTPMQKVDNTFKGIVGTFVVSDKQY